MSFPDITDRNGPTAPAGPPDGTIGPEQVEIAYGVPRARRALGRQLAALRKAAGYSQHEFAPLTLYGRSTLANVETGRQNAPRDFWQRCDCALATGGVLLAGFDAVQALRERARRHVADAAADGLLRATAQPADGLLRATAHPAEVTAARA